MRKNIDTLDSNIQIGTWFRWQKSFFMHQLCASFVPPQSCIPETGIPVYGGSLSGTTGQGFMTKTTGSYEWPVCWYIKPITRGNEKHCPGFVADPASTASQEEDGGVDLELDEPDEEEVANRFREMRDQWLESLGVKE